MGEGYFIILNVRQGWRNKDENNEEPRECLRGDSIACQEVSWVGSVNYCGNITLGKD